MLSAAIELAQIAFGYGFDRVDVTDLAYDALGIAAAMLTAKIYAKRYRALRSAALNL
jgi:glycopeptide antibiotics resistance protein